MQLDNKIKGELLFLPPDQLQPGDFILSVLGGMITANRIHQILPREHFYYVFEMDSDPILVDKINYTSYALIVRPTANPLNNNTRRNT
jgi:hypothetical protein